MSIQIKNLNKSFGDFHALHDINLNVPTGSLTALLGPSGCGKTTLLRIIAGLETATNGQILFDNQDVSHTPVRERQVGFMFQHYALFRHMNVADNIAFGLEVKPRATRPNKTQIKQTVDELLKLVQLEHLAKAYPAQLSGGQRQRIALARALATQPKLLLLDEPFGALDTKVRKELRAWLRQIQQKLGITTILVTHDQEEALEMADEIVVMNHGKIEQIGSGVALYDNPQSVFVTEFLGEVNVLQGEIFSGSLKVGDYREPHSQNQNYPKVSVYVRPHEFHISRMPLENAIGQAQVVQQNLLGSVARLTVATPLSEKPVQIVLSTDFYQQFQTQIGEQIWFKPTRTKVFRLPEIVEYVI
ncbi:sulfate/molybdate ABC transporter ATP-binding protein [Alysiella sp.]|uniref:sulfate/molybdate ABC transporter ATP-binding protein n=1 Tax=Alysiella sp. TaxID=1872483 RepID=UPI0034C5B72E